MSIGCFTDKKQQPDDANVRQVIGSRLLLREALIQHVREAYPTQEDFKFLYGKNYGWALRFRIKGQVLTSLFPATGCFVTQLNLSSGAVEQARAMRLGENVQQVIARAISYPEGRWLFIPIESAQDLQDVQQLLVLRAEDKRLPKSSVI